MIAKWLLLITFALSAYGSGQVWLVQLSSYPLWAFVGRAEFSAYHGAWWRTIWSVVLAPAGLAALGSFLMPLWPLPGISTWAIWAGVGLQVCFIIGTAAWWGPLMARLEGENGGLDAERYALLLSTH
jgi:hypothetical protein